MASSLPQEILNIISGYVAAQDETLGPYALVCKAWQAAFESRIYEELVVLSPSENKTIILGPDGKHVLFEKRGLALERLAAIASGEDERSRARKAAVRGIFYKVGVPYCLSGDKEKLDETSSDDGDDDSLHKEDTSSDTSDDKVFSYDNVFRRHNNKAFTKGMQSLFELLSKWQEKQRPFSLSIVLQAENVYTPDQAIEPATVVSDGLGRLIATYSADMAAEYQLATVNCILSLDFPEAWSPVLTNYIELPHHPNQNPQIGPLAKENGVSPSTALLIASVCGGDALTDVHLDGTHHIPAHERALLMQRRDDVATYLPRLPPSVLRLDIEWQGPPAEFEYPEYPSHPVIKCPPDALCRALRLTSMQLRKLTISGLEILPELFSSDNGVLQTADYWPNLVVIRVKNVPWTTHFGDNLLYTHAPSSSEFLSYSFLEPLYTAAGLAACKMPRLKTMEISFRGDIENLELRTRKGRRGLSIYTSTTYTPSARVGNAWKTQPELTPGRRGRQCADESWETEWDSWPPG